VCYTPTFEDKKHTTGIIHAISIGSGVGICVFKVFLFSLRFTLTSTNEYPNVLNTLSCLTFCKLFRAIACQHV
jgi:hypothetical protein